MDEKIIKALNGYLYKVRWIEVFKFEGAVGEFKDIKVFEATPQEVMEATKKAVALKLQGMPEKMWPAPLGEKHKKAIKEAKEPPRSVKKAYAKEMRELSRKST